MLFSSFTFILVFLPLTLLIFFYIGGRSHHRLATAWLIGASLLFYAWWNPSYLGLILGSILFNYSIGLQLSQPQLSNKKLLLVIGYTINLGLLGYFKYTNFMWDVLSEWFGFTSEIPPIVLPLAISFFTFQQIAYLVDAYKGITREYNFLHYCLFITFFPQLIAGPIVHHKELLPQFASNHIYRINYDSIAKGLMFFFLGLFKKVVFADHLALAVNAVFNAAEQGAELSLLEAWAGSLSYSFQLYFDFSGYSDMAIGIGLMFGIMLPQNFNSPYKAKSISEFWRKWHITLSNFLRDYLYIPLGGSRVSQPRIYINLFLTMLLGGIWHGAGWTFIFWGAIHGGLLCINNFFFKKGSSTSTNSAIRSITSIAVTFFMVTLAWVLFRAESLDGAITIYKGMFGSNGISLDQEVPSQLGKSFKPTWLILSTLVIWGLPNVYEYVINQKAAISLGKLKELTTFRLNKLTSYFLGGLIIYCIYTMLTVINSEFLYFDF